MMNEPYILKYRCASCGADADIDAIHHNTTYRETFSLASDGEAEFYDSEVVEYGEDVTFHCSVCGAQIPTEYPGDIQNLTEWLKRRPENLERVMESL